MHEILMVSLSQRPNNVTSHYFNVQESRLYDASLSESVASTVTLSCTKAPDGRTANYYPRALLWDYVNGFGSLSKFEYFEPKLDSSALQTSYPNVVKTAKAMDRNQYQKQLDEGGNTRGLLTSESVQCWSDFSRVIYRPESKLALDNWEYDFENQEGTLREHPEIKFVGYDVGSKVYKESGADSIEDNFRRLLEYCDTINGLNVLTEQDTAWGGFTAKALEEIRDEYMPKSPILVWSMVEDTGKDALTRRLQLSRIKTVVSLMQQSSLYVPLWTCPRSLPPWATSNWDCGAFHAALIDSVTSLAIQHKNRAGLNEFVGGLTDSEERPYVSGVSLGEWSLGSCPKTRKKNKQERHTFGKTVIRRLGSKPSEDEEKEFQDKECGFMDLVQRGTSYRYLNAYDTYVPFAKSLDSFPEQFQELSDNSLATAKFTVDDAPKEMFAEMFSFVSRFCRDDEREDLKEYLGMMKENYQCGLDSDDDYD